MVEKQQIYKGFIKGQDVPTARANELLQQGWQFPSSIARRWGVQVVTVLGGVKSGRYFYVRLDGHYLLPGDLSYSGVLPGIKVVDGSESKSHDDDGG